MSTQDNQFTPSQLFEAKWPNFLNFLKSHGVDVGSARDTAVGSEEVPDAQRDTLGALDLSNAEDAFALWVAVFTHLCERKDDGKRETADDVIERLGVRTLTADELRHMATNTLIETQVKQFLSHSNAEDFAKLMRYVEFFILVGAMAC
jgi:hypothetical protein